MKMAVQIIITKDGQVSADVIGGRGDLCITHILAGLEELLGPADNTKLKPEYQFDTEVTAILRSQEVKA